jgi:hypothetical protein
MAPLERVGETQNRPGTPNGWGTLEVSVNTAAVWLADIGIFVKETPAISRRDLQSAIDDRRSIKDICREHHVTGRTVAVELRRHGLLEARKKRHLQGQVEGPSLGEQPVEE